MATLNQGAFVRQNRDRLQDPVLIVGSCMYDYDDVDLRGLLGELGLHDITGIDIVDGPGVDEVLDICDAADFEARNRGRFATVLCMEMITHVRQPFGLGATVTELLRPGGTVFLSECIVRKLSRMPVDHWRFTYTGIQLLFPDLDFDHDRVRMSLPRSHTDVLLPYDEHLPEVLGHQRHAEESRFGWYVRKVHDRFLAHGVFRLSRLMPEISIASVATKPE